MKRQSIPSPQVVQKSSRPISNSQEKSGILVSVMASQLKSTTCGKPVTCSGPRLPQIEKKKRAWTRKKKKKPTPPPHCHLFYITRNIRDCTEKQQGRGKGNTQQTELGVWEKWERKSLSISKLRNFRGIRVYMVKITRKIGRKYLEKEMATHSSILPGKSHE